MEQIRFLPCRIVIHYPNSSKVFDYEEIARITCERPYLNVLLKNGKHYYITASLGDFSKKLPPILFQCNRSTIISFNHLAGHDTEGRKMTVTMKDDAVFEVARNRQKEFMERYLHMERLSEPCKFCRSCTEKKFCNQPNPFSLPDGTIQPIGGEV